MHSINLRYILFALPIIGVLVLIGLERHQYRPPDTRESVSFIDYSDRLRHFSLSSMLDTLTSGGICVADVNNDGFDDIFIPGLGKLNNSYAKTSPLGNSLFINSGYEKDIAFENISDTAGIRNLNKLGVGCNIADYDNDGLRDILVANATEGVGFSAFGVFDPASSRRVYPPSAFETKKTDGKYDFPLEGGVTLFKNTGLDANSIPRFEDITIPAGLTRGGNGTAVVSADFDNDGLLDIFVANYTDQDFMGFSHTSFGGQFNVIYKNNGDGSFTDMSRGSNLEGETEYVYDFKGAKQYSWDSKEKDSRGRTVGDPAGNTLAAATIYLDNDLLPDLVVADDVPGRIRIYRNLGGFAFEDVSEDNDMGIAGSWMGFGIGDIDSDGFEDIFATNFGGPRGSRYRISSKHDLYMESIFNPPNKASYYNGLWVKKGGNYDYVSDRINIDWGKWQPDIRWFPPETIQTHKEISAEKPEKFEEGEFGFGNAIFDFNNDGLNDMVWIGSLMRSGLTQQLFMETTVGNPTRLIKNLGGHNFRDVARETGLLNLRDKSSRSSYENGRGLALGDFNNDGYYDVVMTNSGGFDSGNTNIDSIEGLGFEYRYVFLAKEYAPGPTFLYLSSGGENNWLKVNLSGSKSNRDGIGAIVTVSYKDGGAIKKQTKVLRAGESYASQNTSAMIFGLGGAHKVDSIAVRWPSGEETTLIDRPVNTSLDVFE